MEDKIPEPIWIGKTDVAKRQLCEAIRMFFGERDPVAIHTLVAAAHQVLFDIASRTRCRKHGKTRWQIVSF